MFKKLKLHNRTEAAKMENVYEMEADPAEVEAALDEPMEVATEEATDEDVPAQVHVQVSLWQGQVFFKPPPRSDPSWLEGLVMGSASTDEMLRESDTGKRAMNSASSGETPKMDTDLNNMIRTPTNYNKNQRNTAGQEEDGSDCDLGPKGREDSELPKVMKVSNSLEELADAGKDERDAAG